MRRSSAPSRKFISPVLNTTQNQIQSVNVAIASTQNAQNLIEPSVVSTAANQGVRSTSSILNILKTTPPSPKINPDPLNNKQPDKTEINENTGKENSFNQSKKLYNVVWGKKSTKKHKTWEGDGILEIGVKSGILKDTDGNVMGRATIKPELIEEGYILSVGGKEVQIIDLIPPGTQILNSSCKRPAEDELKPKFKPFKKPKSKGLNTNFLGLGTVTKRKGQFRADFEPLVMPQPSAEHQWLYNENKKAVVEVTVDSNLAKVLRPHQRLGVVFLYESVMGYKNQDYFGAILADEMGLGKTLQCITLIWTLLKQGPYGGIPIISRVLIVTPSSLVGNWEKEFLSWLGRERITTFVVDNKNKPKDYCRTIHIPVLIISYEMFVRYYEELNNIKFDLMICDEGHRLKNNTIKASVLLNQLECKRRIILTGTPIQNDLQEFYALSDFVNPGCLGAQNEYRKYFEEPIVISREPDVNEEIKQLGSERAVELNKKTSYFILRRTQEVLDKYLPTKTDIVVFCKSSKLQQNLYAKTIDLWENRDISSKEIAHLSVLTALKKICNHPSLLHNQNQKDTDDTISENLITKILEFVPDQSKMSIEDSGKLKVLFEFLKSMIDLKEKVVIVSSYTQTLDLIAEECNQSGYKYCRLDGSVPSSQRTKIVQNFNNTWSKDQIFLLSAKAGGVGLNLVGASRLVLFDSDWNPATDLQAMSRVWRDGQKKSVYLYRFLTTGTIEEKIYQRQISKTGLSGAIVDPSNKSSIRMSDDELKDLFSIQFDSYCSTHTLLNCDCNCDGSIPEPHKNKKDSETDDLRTCQLGVQQKDSTTQSLKMNQLMQWEHHKNPFNENMMQELGLIDIMSEISFIFKNKCSL